MTAPPLDLVARAQAIVDGYGPGAWFTVEPERPFYGRPWAIHWYGGANSRCGTLCTVLDGDAAHRGLAVLQAAGFSVVEPSAATG